MRSRAAVQKFWGSFWRPSRSSAWRLAWVMGFGVLSCSGPTLADPTLADPTLTETTGALPPEFLTCYAIRHTGERLACYDRAVEYLRQPSEQVSAPSAEASFGLQGRANGARDDKSSETESRQTTSVTARIANIDSSRDGLQTITLDNGQVWRQVTSSNLAFPTVGDEVTISRAALGSFLMRIPNGGPLRVRRIQ